MRIVVLFMLAVLVSTLFSIDVIAKEKLMIADAAGRVLSVPDPVHHAICSGPGALRLLTYLGAQDLIVAVDDIETMRRRFDARPYALAHPEFKEYPIFGEFRGFDNPELILALERQPQVIFKTFATMGYDPVELQEKTGIPTVVLEYGNLDTHRPKFSKSLRIMGQIVGRQDRAEEIIEFFDSAMNDLKSRTDGVPESDKKTCFVGGIAYKGPHGYRSTEPGYPPFMFVNAANVAYDESLMGKASRQVTVAKEKLLDWDPDVLFLDLSSLQLEGKASGLWEIGNDPVLKTLAAVQAGRVYGVLPYNWYTRNYGSILANAYFIGKILYPDRFEDVDPVVKADEIYEFLVGRPVFNEMNAFFMGMAFKSVFE
ncbi:MAG: iron ABC transporter substrate-binding protein [Thermodesulfobacteriota bacterium]